MPSNILPNTRAVSLMSSLWPVDVILAEVFGMPAFLKTGNQNAHLVRVEGFSNMSATFFPASNCPDADLLLDLRLSIGR